MQANLALKLLSSEGISRRPALRDWKTKAGFVEMRIAKDSDLSELKSARAEARTSISTPKLRFCASPKDSGFDSFSIRFAGGEKGKANVLGGMLRSPV